eukprot:PhM_4_TR15917/c0_g2_i1/m.26276/K04959/ITPR2; inositol 1,4,5-triphosphate receptor type 2
MLRPQISAAGGAPSLLSSGQVPLCFGDKIALRVENNIVRAGGFARAVNSSQVPLAIVTIPKGRRVPPGFENCIFQILSGDGDVKNSTTFNLGSGVHYGQVVRLLHVKTNQIVCCTKRLKAFKQKGNYKVSLEDLSEEARGNRWRLMPRYRVKGEGERVTSQDEIVLQLHGHQMYLHTSSIPSELDEGVRESAYFELNCTSSSDSVGVAFRLHAYDTSQQYYDFKDRAVCCGDCIVMYHKHERGFVSVGLDPANHHVYIDSPQGQAADSLAMAEPSSHAIFMPEAQDPLVGGAVKVGPSNLYRLKHLSTGKYLSVLPAEEAFTIDIDGGDDDDAPGDLTMSCTGSSMMLEFGETLEDVKFGLEDNPLGPGTLFTFHSVTSDLVDHISNYGRVSMECVDADSAECATAWLTIGGRIGGPDSSGDQRKEVALSATPHQRDALQVRIISPAVFQRLYAIHNQLPPIKTCTAALRNGTVPQEQQMVSARDALTAMIRCCTMAEEPDPFERVGIPVFEMQGLLVDQHTPRLCLELVAALVSETCVVRLTRETMNSTTFIRGVGVRPCDLRDLARLALRLARLCCTGSPRACEQVIPHLGALLDHAFHGIGAFGCLLAVVSSAEDLVKSPEDTTLVTTAMTMLKTYPGFPQTLRLLRHVVDSRYEGIGYGQLQVLDMLADIEPIMLRIDRQGENENKKCIVMLPTDVPGEFGSRDLIAFLTKKPEDDDAAPDTKLSTVQRRVLSSDLREDPRVHEPGANAVDFLTEQLNFLSSLCAQRSPTAAKFAQRFAPDAVLLDIVQNESLKLRPRTAALRLYRALVMDVDPFRATNLSVIVKVWGHLGEDMAKERHPQPPELDNIIDWCIDTMQANASLRYGRAHTDLNVFLSEVVRTLAMAVSYGWMSPGPRRARLLSALVTTVEVDDDQVGVTLDAAPAAVARRVSVSDDEPALATAHNKCVLPSRYSYAEASASVVDCKAHCVHLLTLLFDVTCVEEGSRHLDLFASSGPKADFHICNLADFGIAPELHIAPPPPGSKKRGKKDARVYPSNEAWAVLKGLHSALLGAQRYEYPPLSRVAIRLLMRLFDYRTELHTFLERFQLIVNEESLTFYLAAQRLLEELVRRTKGPRLRLSHPRLLEILTELSDLTPVGCIDLSERQSILRNVGLIDELNQIIQVARSRGSRTEKSKKAVLEKCYFLLSRMCFNNAEISALVFDNADTYMAHLDLDVGVLELFIVILDENYELLSSVPETFFRGMLASMVERDLHPTFVLFLRHILWVSGKPMPRLQSLLWKEILDIHANSDASSERLLAMHDVWTGDRGVCIRNGLFEEKEYESALGRTCFHVQWVSLLWSLIKGKDPKAKRELNHVAFQGYGVVDVLEVVANPSLPLYYRSVYVKLFHEAFVDDPTHVDTLLENIDHLITFLDLCASEVALLTSVVSQITAPMTLHRVQQLLDDIIAEARATTPPGTASVVAGQHSVDVEVLVYHVFASVLQCTRHLITQVLFCETKPNMTVRRRLNELVDHIVALVDAHNRALEAWEEGIEVLPRLSPTRKISGSRKHDVRFPSETTHIPTDQDRFLFSMSLQDKKRLKDLLVECVSKSLFGTQTREDLDGIIANLQRQMALDVADAERVQQQTTPKGQVVIDWQQFVQRHEPLTEDRFVSMALYLMHLGRTGEDAFRSIIRHLRVSNLRVSSRSKIFLLATQMIRVQDRKYQDDIWLLYKGPIQAVTSDGVGQHRNVFHMALEERQCHIDRVTEIAPVVLECVALNEALHESATVAGIALLDGGNKQVQTSMMDYLLAKRDEGIFQASRNHMVSFMSLLRKKLEDTQRLTGSSTPGCVLSDATFEKLAPKYRCDHILVLLRFLQLMCEGHNAKVQDYLRIQHDNQISVDVVEATTGLLVSILKCGVDRITHPLCLQCIASLTEYVQGPCPGNQRRLIGSNIGTCVNLLMSHAWPDLSAEDQWALKEQTSTLLLALIEGRPSPTLVAELVQTLRLNALADIMDESYRAYKGKKRSAQISRLMSAGTSMMRSVVNPNSHDIFSDALNLGCNAFIFFRSVVDMAMRTVTGTHISGEQYWESILDRDGNSVKGTLRQHPNYKYFNRLVGSIEILRNGVVEKVYYRVPSMSRQNLHPKSRALLLKEVDRENVSTKLQDFFERSLDLIYEINFFKELSETRGMSVLHKMYPVLDSLSLFLSFVLNGLMLVFVRLENRSDDPLWNMPTDIFGDVFGWLAQTMLAIQGFLTLHFFAGELRIHVAYAWRLWEHARRDEEINESKSNMALDPPVFHENIRKSLNPLHRLVLSIRMALTYPPLWQRVLFLVACVVGNLYHPFFFSIQLLQLVGRTPQLQNVVLAVTTNGRTLLLTFGLLLIVIYMFSMLAYYDLNKYITNSDIGSGFRCSSLFWCTMILLSYGLRQGGGIGDVEAPPDWNAPDDDIYGRIIYDFAFFTIMIIIFLNILFGIIIDTFAELRESREAMAADQTGSCFICGIEKSTLDRRGATHGGFEHHYHHDHNMWQYLYFMHYLTLKPYDELSGQEHYVHAMIMRNEIGFFPIGRALCLETADELAGHSGDDAVGDGVGSGGEGPSSRDLQNSIGEVGGAVCALGDKLAAKINALDGRMRAAMLATSGPQHGMH